MYKRSITVLLQCLFIMLLSLDLVAQHVPSLERGDPKLRRKAQMEGNNVRTTIFNYGHTGRTGGVPIYEETPYEWPKNTGKVYLAQTTLFVGGEVRDNNDDLQRIIIVDNGRQSPDGKSWNFEPVPGYFNPKVESIANSVDSDTWPSFWPDKAIDEVDPGWPGSWNGYFGKNIFNADQEIFYRASDDRYDRYTYYFPDTTDLTRKGLGIMLDVRVMTWSQVLVSDVVYILQTIKNDGTRDIDKFAVTVGIADFVGGDGDSQDDISEFDLLEDMMWSRDSDHKAPTFGNDPVGIVGVSLLETPGNAADRIDNDGDGEDNGPIVSEEMLEDEDPTNLIDDNGNGLIDENQTHVPFGTQQGVSYADRIDNDGDGEENSPVITQAMVDLSENDRWKRWPVNPENDILQQGAVHLIMVENDDIGYGYRDFIDNNDNGEENSPVITQSIIDQAAGDAPYYRYKIPGKNIILYDVKNEDIGKRYADGIDNDGDGAIDEFIDENIDEMVDERRDDFIDNDGDWNPFTDDVGLDGVSDTGDRGENDGVPTSGAGLGLPGEPNIDVTDVSETDQIGITNAARTPAGGLNINSDATMWFDFMIPGKFYDPQSVVAGEYDLWVSTAYFPLKAGQSEPVSMAVILANAPVPDPGGELRKAEVLKKRTRAQETYNNDYQFANAPITPRLTAVPGDNKVTLYWDNEAEMSFDSYINNIGGNGNDFEGYRIYRSSDPAFEDVLNITDAYGSLKFRTPIKQFDLVDNYSGLDSVGLDGANFYLGSNSGLQHSWVDSTVKNGYTYYYAITSYDFGFPAGNIIPTESPIRLTVLPDGDVKLGPNVARITPEAPAAGYIPPTLGEIELIEGSTTGQVGYDIIDVNKINDSHTYFITFEDTLKKGSKSTVPDTLTTKNFSLFDSTANSYLIYRSSNLATNYEQPMTDGFRLKFTNESRLELNTSLSGWSSPEIPAFSFKKFVQSTGPQGVALPYDYEIIFGDVGFGHSQTVVVERTTFNEKDVNFKVYNKSTGQFIDFGFVELDQSLGGPGVFSGAIVNRLPRYDIIVFLEPNDQDSLVFSWQFSLKSAPDTTLNQRIPQANDSAYVFLKKPFLSSDIFRFTSQIGKIDKKSAKEGLDHIKVVPNPYMATAAWEPKNPYNSGRGPRSIHFTHLPAKCTIRIFTINGELVDKIEHDSPVDNGTAYWDLMTKDNLTISYGIYVYHVDAPGVGEKVGKFAVIK